MLSVNDFFSGCGGLSQGFKEAGFKIQVAVDKEEAFLKTFSHNFGGSQTKNLDLGDDNVLKDIPKADIIIGGPPCQGFSLTGPRNIDDPRNKLYLSVFKSLKLTNPKAFVVENVRGLKTMWEGNVFKEIIKKTKRLNDPKNIFLNLRQAKELEEAELNIKKALEEKSEEIISEYLRQTNRSLERIIGNIDVEEVLGNIFSNFCIGK